MTPNMGKLDRGLRGFVVAPVAITGALLIGAGTVGGVILSSSRGSCWSQRPRGTARTTPSPGSRPTRACTASAITSPGGPA